MSRFRFVSECAPDYGVKRLCGVMKVSVLATTPGSGAPLGAAVPDDASWALSSARSTGAPARPMAPPRVHAELRRLDQRCGRKRRGPPDGEGGAGWRPYPQALAHRPPRHCPGTGPGESQLRTATSGPDLGGRRHPVPDRTGLALLRRRDRPLQPPRVGWAMSTSPTPTW